MSLGRRTGSSPPASRRRRPLSAGRARQVSNGTTEGCCARRRVGNGDPRSGVVACSLRRSSVRGGPGPVWVGVATASAQPVTTLRTCAFGALQAAVAKGGLVLFACSGTIAFTGPITVKPGRAVTLDGTGASVALDGQSSTGCSVLSAAQGKTEGANVTLIDLTLQNAKFTGTAGWTGTLGASGSNGADGLDGTNGADGSPRRGRFAW